MKFCLLNAGFGGGGQIYETHGENASGHVIYPCLMFVA